MSPIRPRLTAIALVIGLGLPFASGATEQDFLTVAQVIDRLAALGYSDVLEIELERDRYEAEARGKDGAWYEVEVDARTGELVHVEPDED
jgi:uncharacterized membrane protein YkoI